jgi:16S rRNA (guanine1207-N2)-methyltransferase
MEQIENTIGTSSGSFQLQRFPLRKKETLRAWDAADEYILQYLDENELLNEGVSLLIVNDGFGALSIPLSHYAPVVMTDSYLSMQAISENLKINNLDSDSLTIINSLHAPDSVLEKKADVVLIKLPKSLAMLEDQLYRIRSAVDASTKIIAAGMTKRIHMSTMALFEKVIGPTKTSLAHKKSRLIFSEFDATIGTIENPYPDVYELGYQLDDVELKMINHAGVYSREKLDLGSRLFLENLPVSDSYKTIVDLGCGNGVLGLMAAIKNPTAKIIFTDESYMAVESSIDNFMKVFGETRDVEFLQTDCLYGVEEDSASLVMCNPPFHQDNAINDDVAWQMFTESKAVLEKNGELWVIGNRHLGYHAKLKHLFGDCEVIASNKKFTLLRSVKSRAVKSHAAKSQAVKS